MLTYTQLRYAFAAAVLLAAAAPLALACPDCGCTAAAGKPAVGAEATVSMTADAAAATADAKAPAKDRAAILALAGEYEVDFNFEETLALARGYELKEPYHSKATELVTVVEDRGDFISLQHVLVVRPEGEDGEPGEPRVVKHWRQDWTYEDTRLLEYQGRRVWKPRTISAEQAEGTWTQAVFQVDDGPRYEGIGAWVHDDGVSAWESNAAWRPLPRRERTTRDDYHVMVSRTRLTHTPAGWVHEQDNSKLVLGEGGAADVTLAREVGLNRYDRGESLDLGPAKAYWAKTAAFWADVRDAWAVALDVRGPVKVAVAEDGDVRYQQLFRYANDLAEGGLYDREAGRAWIAKTIARYVSGLEQASAE